MIAFAVAGAMAASSLAIAAYHSPVQTPAVVTHAYTDANPATKCQAEAYLNSALRADRYDPRSRKGTILIERVMESARPKCAKAAGHAQPRA